MLVSGTQRFKYFATPADFSPQYHLFPKKGDEKVANLSQLPKRWQKSNDSNNHDRCNALEPIHSDGTRLSKVKVKRKKKKTSSNDEDSCNDVPQSPKSAALDEIRMERELWEREKKEKEALLSHVTDEESIQRYQTILQESEKKGFELKEKEMDEIIELKMKAITQRIQKQFASNNAAMEDRAKVRYLFNNMVQLQVIITCSS